MATVTCCFCEVERELTAGHIEFSIPRKDKELLKKAICFACLAQLGLRISRWRHDGTWDRVLLGAGLKRKHILLPPKYNPITGKVEQ
jgi:hypothetical protein